MNRKLLNILLIGAIVISSGSFMTSCSKNYDDDISSLKNQVSLLATADQLKTQVATLQAAITAAQTTATAAQTAAAAAVTPAQLSNALAPLNTLISGKASQTKLDSITKVFNSSLASIQTLLGQKADASLYNKKIDSLKVGTSNLSILISNLKTKENNDIIQLRKGALDSIAKDITHLSALRALTNSTAINDSLLCIKIQNKEIADYTTTQSILGGLTSQYSQLNGYVTGLLGSISTMVTGVDICTANGYDNKIDFIKAVEKTATFGPNGEYTFRDGNIDGFEDAILIRVSPTTATITPDSISLLDSKGNSLSDYIIIESVEPYTDLVTSSTRTTTLSNGLWKVVLKLNLKTKDNATKFENAVMNNGNYVDFCVAINSKITGSKDRRVVSDYGLTVTANDAPEANVLSYSAGGKDVTTLHNNSVNNEYTWLNNVAAVTPVYNSQQGTVNTVLDQNDNRTSLSPLPVVKGGQIAININQNIPIKGFYVSLDRAHSTAAQLATWGTYGYNNLNVVQNGNSGTITVTDIGGAASAVIGLRVYAVNYDGTLVDPDGRAFYVSVGKPQTQITYSTTITPIQDVSTNSSIISTGDLSDLVNATELYPTPSMAQTPAVSGLSANNQIFNIAFYKSDGVTPVTSPSDASKIAYIQVTMPEPANFADGQTYTQNYIYTNANGNAIREITVNMTKQMPDASTTQAEKAVFMKSTQIDGNGNYNCYLVANGIGFNQMNANYGTMNLEYACNGLSDLHGNVIDQNVEFTFGGAGTNGNDLIINYPSNNYNLSLATSYINNSTKYPTIIKYNFGPISSSATTHAQPWKVQLAQFNTIFCDNFNSSVMSWGWTPGATTAITYGQQNSILASTIQSNNTFNRIDFNKTLQAFVSSLGYLQITQIHLNTKADRVVPDEYFTVSYSTNGNLTFNPTQTSITTNPTGSIPSQLVISAVDCYGYPVSIQLNMTVNPR